MTPVQSADSASLGCLFMNRQRLGTILLLLALCCETVAQVRFGGVFENSFDNISSARPGGFTTDQSTYLQNYQWNFGGHLISEQFISYTLRNQYFDSNRSGYGSTLRTRNFDLYNLQCSLLKKRAASFDFIVRKNINTIDNPVTAYKSSSDQISSFVNLRFHSFPSTRVGYQLFQSKAQEKAGSQTEITTLDMNSSNSQNRSVNLSFRNEILKLPGSGRLDYNRECSLKGAAPLLDERVTVSPELSLTERNSLRNIRANLRALGRVRDGVQFQSFYSYLFTQSDANQLYSHSFFGNFQQELNRRLLWESNARLQRTSSSSDEASHYTSDENISSGLVYLRQQQNSNSVVEMNGRCNVEYRRSWKDGVMTGADGSGSVEWIKKEDQDYAANCVYTLSGSFFAGQQPAIADMTNRILLNLQVSPAGGVSAENRIIATDRVGSRGLRDIEETFGFLLRVSREVHLRSTITWESEVKPVRRQMFYLRNEANWKMTRKATLSLRSSLVSNGRSGFRQFWVESDFDWILGQTNVQFQGRVSKDQGLMTRSITLKASRTIGRSNVAG
jgi:hypothetical protein